MLNSNTVFTLLLLLMLGTLPNLLPVGGEGYILTASINAGYTSCSACDVSATGTTLNVANMMADGESNGFASARFLMDGLVFAGQLTIDCVTNTPWTSRTIPLEVTLTNSVGTGTTLSRFINLNGNLERGSSVTIDGGTFAIRSSSGTLMYTSGVLNGVNTLLKITGATINQYDVSGFVSIIVMSPMSINNGAKFELSSNTYRVDTITFTASSTYHIRIIDTTSILIDGSSALIVGNTVQILRSSRAGAISFFGVYKTNVQSFTINNKGIMTFADNTITVLDTSLGSGSFYWLLLEPGPTSVAPNSQINVVSNTITITDVTASEISASYMRIKPDVVFSGGSVFNFTNNDVSIIRGSTTGNTFVSVLFSTGALSFPSSTLIMTRNTLSATNAVGGEFSMNVFNIQSSLTFTGATVLAANNNVQAKPSSVGTTGMASLIRTTAVSSISSSNTMTIKDNVVVSTAAGVATTSLLYFSPNTVYTTTDVAISGNSVSAVGAGRYVMPSGSAIGVNVCRNTVNGVTCFLFGASGYSCIPNSPAPVPSAHGCAVTPTDTKSLKQTQSEMVTNSPDVTNSEDITGSVDVTQSQEVTTTRSVATTQSQDITPSSDITTTPSLHPAPPTPSSTESRSTTPKITKSGNTFTQTPAPSLSGSSSTTDSLARTQSTTMTSTHPRSATPSITETQSNIPTHTSTDSTTQTHPTPTLGTPSPSPTTTRSHTPVPDEPTQPATPTTTQSVPSTATASSTGILSQSTTGPTLSHLTATITTSLTPSITTTATDPTHSGATITDSLTITTSLSVSAATKSAMTPTVSYTASPTPTLSEIPTLTTTISTSHGTPTSSHPQTDTVSVPTTPSISRSGGTPSNPTPSMSLTDTIRVLPPCNHTCSDIIAAFVVPASTTAEDATATYWATYNRSAPRLGCGAVLVRFALTNKGVAARVFVHVDTGAVTANASHPLVDLPMIANPSSTIQAVSASNNFSDGMAVFEVRRVDSNPVSSAEGQVTMLTGGFVCLTNGSGMPWLNLVMDAPPPTLTAAEQAAVAVVSAISPSLQTVAAMSLLRCSPGDASTVETDSTIRALVPVALSGTCAGAVQGAMLAVAVAGVFCALATLAVMRVRGVRWMEAAAVTRCPGIAMGVWGFLQMGLVVCGARLVTSPSGDTGDIALGVVGVLLGAVVPAVSVALAWGVVSRRCYRIGPTAEVVSKSSRVGLWVRSMLLPEYELDTVRYPVSKAYSTLVSRTRLVGSIWAAVPMVQPVIMLVVVFVQGIWCSAALIVAGVITLLLAAVCQVWYRPHRIHGANYLQAMSMALNAAVLMIGSKLTTDPTDPTAVTSNRVVSMVQVGLSLLRMFLSTTAVLYMWKWRDETFERKEPLPYECPARSSLPLADEEGPAFVFDYSTPLYAPILTPLNTKPPPPPVLPTPSKEAVLVVNELTSSPPETPPSPPSQQLPNRNRKGQEPLQEAGDEHLSRGGHRGGVGSKIMSLFNTPKNTRTFNEDIISTLLNNHRGYVPMERPYTLLGGCEGDDDDDEEEQELKDFFQEEPPDKVDDDDDLSDLSLKGGVLDGGSEEIFTGEKSSALSFDRSSSKKEEDSRTSRSMPRRTSSFLYSNITPSDSINDFSSALNNSSSFKRQPTLSSTDLNEGVPVLSTTPYFLRRIKRKSLERDDEL